MPPCFGRAADYIISMEFNERFLDLKRKLFNKCYKSLNEKQMGSGFYRQLPSARARRRG